MVPAPIKRKSISAARVAPRSAFTITSQVLILLRYAQESSWREDNRRVSNGDQVSRIAALAMKRGKSVRWRGAGQPVGWVERSDTHHFVVSPC